MMNISESVAARQTGLAIARFFGFFFVLILTLAILIATYTLFAGSPLDQAWDAVKALIVSAIILLILAVLSFWVAGMFSGTDTTPAATTATGTIDTPAP